MAPELNSSTCVAAWASMPSERESWRCTVADEVTWAKLMVAATSPFVAGGVGLLGVFLGGWLSDRRARDKKQKEFIIRQLEEFYGPLVGLRAEVRSCSNLRNRVQNAADEVWRRMSENASRKSVEESQRLSKERFPEFAAIIQDDNITFTDKLIPTYRRMINIFRDKLWLAEPETRAFFPMLVEFVDLWERHLREALPVEVVNEMGHTEAKLHPFYDHLERTMDTLRKKLARA